MSIMSGQVSAAREAARGADGRFGEQPRTDPGQLCLDQDPDLVEYPVPRVREWTVDPDQFEAMAARVAELNERAARKGWTGRFTLTGTERLEATERDGLQVATLWIDARLDGDPPRYEGWQFLGTLEQVQTGPDTSELIIRTQPGAGETGIDRASLQAGVCDHCGSARHRRKLYLVRSSAGETRQVGSMCVKDFLGWDTLPPLVDTDTACEDIGRHGGPSDGPHHPTDYTVALALAAVAEYGWHSSNQERPTSQVVAAALDPGKAGAQVRRALAGRLEQARAQAPVVIAELLEGLDLTSDYSQNLLVALRAPATSARRLNLVVSSVAAWKRLKGEQLRDARNAASVWVGKPGDHITPTVTVERADTVDGYAYDTTQRLLVLRDGDQNLLRAYSSARWTYQVREGDTFPMVATVKKHEEYRGIRQTLLTRIRRAKPAT